MSIQRFNKYVQQLMVTQASQKLKYNYLLLWGICIKSDRSKGLKSNLTLNYVKSIEAVRIRWHSQRCHLRVSHVESNYEL